MVKPAVKTITVQSLSMPFFRNAIPVVSRTLKIPLAKEETGIRHASLHSLRLVRLHVTVQTASGILTNRMPLAMTRPNPTIENEYWRTPAPVAGAIGLELGTCWVVQDLMLVVTGDTGDTGDVPVLTGATGVVQLPVPYGVDVLTGPTGVVGYGGAGPQPVDVLTLTGPTGVLEETG